MITISKALLREIHDHTEASYPYECCGLLIGTASGGGERTTHTFRKCKNLNTERAHDRYEMDPKCMLDVQREFRDGPWEVIGCYHSHPDHPSRPSKTDTELALRIWAYTWSFMIVSVRNGTVAGAQSWVLNEVEQQFHEEPLVADEGDRK